MGRCRPFAAEVIISKNQWSDRAQKVCRGREDTQNKHLALGVTQAADTGATVNSSSTGSVLFRTLYAKEQRAALGLPPESTILTTEKGALSSSASRGEPAKKDHTEVMSDIWDVPGSQETTGRSWDREYRTEYPRGTENQAPKKKKKRRPMDPDAVSLVPMAETEDHNLPDTAPVENDINAAFPRPSQIYPDEETIQSLIPLTESYPSAPVPPPPRPGSIYIAPSVLSAAEREQYTNIDVASSANSSLHYDDAVRIEMGRRTLPRHPPSSYAPTIPATTQEEFRREAPPEETLVMSTSALHPLEGVPYYAPQSTPAAVMLLPPTQSPHAPVRRPKLEKLLKKRKSTITEPEPQVRRRSLSPDILNSDGPPPVKKQKSLARGDTNSGQNELPSTAGANEGATNWLPDTAPVALMVISRSMVDSTSSGQQSRQVGGPENPIDIPLTESFSGSLNTAPVEQRTKVVVPALSLPLTTPSVVSQSIQPVAVEPPPSKPAPHLSADPSVYWRHQIADSEAEDDSDIIPVEAPPPLEVSKPSLVREPSPKPAQKPKKKQLPEKKQKARKYTFNLRAESPDILESIEQGPPIRESIEKPELDEMPAKRVAKKTKEKPRKKTLEKPPVTVILDSDSEDNLSREPTLADFPGFERYTTSVIADSVVPESVIPETVTEAPRDPTPPPPPPKKEPAKREKVKKPTKKKLAAAKKAAAETGKQSVSRASSTTGTSASPALQNPTSGSPAPALESLTSVPAIEHSTPRRSESVLSETRSTSDSNRAQSASTVSVSSESLAVAVPAAQTPVRPMPNWAAASTPARTSPGAGTPNTGKPVFRVGLSRRTRIAPLLKVIRKP